MKLSVKNKKYIKSKAEDLELYIANTIYTTDKLLNMDVEYPYVEYRRLFFNTDILITYRNFRIYFNKNEIIVHLTLKKDITNKLESFNELRELGIEYFLNEYIQDFFYYFIIKLPYRYIDILKKLILEIYKFEN